MEVHLLKQPFAEQEQIGRLLIGELDRPDRQYFYVAVAWAKASGLSRLTTYLRAFRDRGGHAEAILGVDANGATKEGLELALNLFNRVYIFYDPGQRTFHPKLYLLAGEQTATAIVGSGNLTKGGLFLNYELGVVITIDRHDESDADLLQDLLAYYESLKAIQPACQPLDAALLATLLQDPSIPITSEAAANTARANLPTSPKHPTVFGSAVPGLAHAPPIHATPLPHDESDVDLTPALAQALAPAQPPQAPAVAAFWKRLSSSDVSPTSSPGQIIIPLHFLGFFPPLQLQFDNTATGGPKQSDVTIALRFHDGPFRKSVTNARAVLYEPASFHPRRNRELRFTFHDPEVFARLSAGDVLVFSRTQGLITVERRPPGSMGPGRFGPL